MKSSSSRLLLHFKNVVVIGILWAIVTLILALAFGLPPLGQKAPEWYLIVSYILEEGAYLGAALLCFRNWNYRHIVSDRNIWLCFGWGTLIYLVANIIFAYWDLVLKRAPDVSLADPFFILAYLFLLLGMLLAVKSRGFYLKIWQWSVLALVAAIAIWLGWLVSHPPEDTQTTLMSAIAHSDGYLAEKLSLISDNTAQELVPSWVLTVEKILEPFTNLLSLLYVINDVFLLIIATTLLLTFWGGRFSQTWTLIAIAVLLLYFADIRYAYVVTRAEYQVNSIIDTFWTFSAIIFAMAAAWEFDLSFRPLRRSSLGGT